MEIIKQAAVYAVSPNFTKSFKSHNVYNECSL